LRHSLLHVEHVQIKIENTKNVKVCKVAQTTLPVLCLLQWLTKHYFISEYASRRNFQYWYATCF